MTTIIKSATDTTTAVLGTIGTVANTFSQSVDTVAKSLDMLDMFVITAHTKQKARTAVDLSTFYDQLIEDTAIESSERQLEIQTKLKDNPQLLALYTENSAKLAAILNPTDTL